MQIPLEITYRDVEKTESLDDLIRRKAEGLDRVCDHLISCRVAVERPQKSQTRGRQCRVRIDMRVPPGHELVVRSEPSRGGIHEEPETVVRDTFDIARRQLKNLVEKQRGRVKVQAGQQVMAIVRTIFPDQDYGFLVTPEGREIYFHRNAVLNGEFERLRVGDGVRYVESDGEKGPQASSVHLEERPSL